MRSSHVSPVVHLELHTGDLPRAGDFYARLLGWHPQRIETGGGSYLAPTRGRRSTTRTRRRQAVRPTRAEL
jgi:predicted enzyme related to lactoylglutathione lyase